MRRVAMTLIRCAAALAGMGLAAASYAIDIEGVPALTPVLVPDVTATVSHQTLEIPYPGGCLHIHPWPDFLPRKLHAQSLLAERQPWPSGPTDRVAFTRKGEKQPWLVIVSHGRTTTPVIGGWRVERIDGRWHVVDGTQQVPLPEKPSRKAFASIMSGNQRWQVHALSIDKEMTGRPSASEHEPRISWAAVRR